MRGRAAPAVSWALAVLAAIALATAALLFYADRTVFDSDAFADRAAASLEAPEVRDAAARRLTNVVVGVHPNLVALRPIIELAARGAIGTAQFRALLRRAALDAHRSAFDDHSREAAVRLRDAGVVIAAAVERLQPDLAERIPTRFVARLVRIKGDVNRSMLRLAELAENARPARWIALAAAVLLALGAFVITDSRRAALGRLGLALAVVGAVVALVSALAPGILSGGAAPADGSAVSAVVGVWLDPVTAWSLAASVIGLVVALGAAAIVRPIPIVAIVRRGSSRVTSSPRTQLGRVLRTLAAMAVGGAMLMWPRGAITLAVVAVGAVIVLAAVAELLALAAGPTGSAAPRRSAGGRRAARIGMITVLTAGAVAVAAALSDGESPAVAPVGRCNGQASLCDRRVDQVAFLGTHNSMAAAGEAGWFFAAQDAAIPDQLDDGVRALLIDTHYGIGTPRGVATDLGGQSRAKLVDEVGERFVNAAERVRRRIGRNPTGEREIFLCHTFCEVGATRALDALRAAHDFLVMHPEEVLLLSIQDDTSAADTAALIRASGLSDEVYLGKADRPWPTLRELIDRDERVIVLAENHAGGARWIHHQPVVVQETPYRFKTVEELEAPASCEPNRGGTAGSMLLVNHWVDTSPAPRVTIARRVNAYDFLTRRLSLCRRERGLLANIVAVDFYRQGDAARVVDDLNDVG